MACINNGISVGGRGMGIGLMGDDTIVYKKQNRWTIEISPNCQQIPKIPASFATIASRPNISIEETQLDFLNERMWIPGKPSWETINVTYLDVGGQSAVARQLINGLYGWLSSVYDFTGDCRWMGSSARDYAASVSLFMYDGCGKVMEEWVLGNAWPTSVNFGDLDMSSGEVAKIELTLRYSQVQYFGICPAFVPPECCTGC